MGNDVASHVGETNEAVASEYRVVRSRIIEQRAQVERLRALVERLEEQVARDERFLAKLKNVLGFADQLRIDELIPCCAERLREVALEVLAEEVGPGREIHYRDWFALVYRARHQIGGHDPLRPSSPVSVQSRRLLVRRGREAGRRGLWRRGCR